jgi:hypothetical protein
MGMSRFERGLALVGRDLERMAGASASRRKASRELLLELVLTAREPADWERALGSGPVRGMRTHVQALLAELRRTHRLPKAVCAKYRYNQSECRVMRRYGVSPAEWRAVHELARCAMVDMARYVGALDYEALAWHDKMVEDIVRVEVVLDPRAFDDVLIAALEAYLSPRKRKSYEVYGITLGMCRDETAARRGAGTMITRYVSVARAQPQLSAQGGPRHVFPSFRSFTAIETAVCTLFPHYEVVGDFHSHVFNDLSSMDEVRGWAPSGGDASYCAMWTKEMRDRGRRPQVDLIVAIARCTYPPGQLRYKRQANTLQVAIGDCRAVLGAHRILPGGAYSSRGIRLSVAGF